MKRMVLIMILSACSMTPPKTKKIPKKLEEKHGTRIDNYYWIRDLKWTNNRKTKNKFEDMLPEVQSHLKKEKQFTDQYLKKIKPSMEKIFQEIKSRIPENDEGVPYFNNGYWYYHKFISGKEYPIYYRKKDHLKSKEELLLNPNELVGDSKVFKIGTFKVSPNNKVLAYAVDTNGNRVYTIYFKNLETGELLKQKLENVSSNLEWGGNSEYFFLNHKNPVSLRSESIMRYRFSDLKSEKVFYESDNEFDVYISSSSSDKYLMITSAASESNEMYFLERDRPLSKIHLFRKRENGHKLYADHINDRFYFKSNKYNENYSFYWLPEDNIKTKWNKFIELNKDDYVQGFDLFSNYVVLSVRKNGTKNLLITNHKNENPYYLEHPDTGYVVYSTSNYDKNSHLVRFYYETPITPEQIVEWDMKNKKRIIKKTKKIGGGFESEKYMSERRSVLSRDQKEIPITIVKRKDVQYDKNTPLLIYGYGSYGSNIEPYFRSHLISLLDRGFIYVIAHIRGSSFLGRTWYLDGKFLNKKNTFNDFIDVAQYLVDKKMTSPKKLFASGGSAGGLLMGAVINQRPELFNGVIASVPFVDSLTTMLDEDLPLTTGEYQEWGNPNEKKYYDYMLSYSPYDNIRKLNYPKVLATGSIHDTQVGYWEPGKWVSKLREFQTNSDNPILFDVELSTGHSGESGRYNAYKRVAKNYALLDYWAKSSM